MLANMPLFLTLLLLPANLVLACQEVTAPNCPLTSEVSFHAHETSCSLYYRCEFGQISTFSCEHGQRFREILQRCDDADMVECNRCSSSLDLGIIGTAECPPTPGCSPGDFGLLKPYPEDCTKYIYCDTSNNPSVRSCPAGNHFSPTANICTSPANAACPECFISTSTVVISTTLAPGVCEEIPTCGILELGVLKPYPLDCTRYIYCGFLGVPQIRYCYSDLHFSPSEGFCTAPEDANCPLCIESTVPSPTSPSTTTEVPITSTEDPCPLPECAITDWGVLKAHPRDCSLYFYCDTSAVPNLRYCYTGQLFSVDVMRCVPADDAVCATCGPTTTVEEVTSTTELSTTIQTTTEVSCDIPKCDPLDFFVTRPYPPNCTLFILCSFPGFSDIMECRDGESYSPTLRRCTAPEIAQCTPCIEETTTEEPTTTVDPCPLHVCTPDEWGATYPHTTDCGKYLYCSMTGETSIRFCPTGQLYSVFLQRCVASAEAECFICGETTTAEVIITTTEEPTTTEPTTPEPTTPEPTTPEPTTPEPTTEAQTTTVANCGDIPQCYASDFFETKPYPSDCTKFVFCSFPGMPADILQCPDGQHYSATLERCVVPEIAQCTPCIIETTTLEATTTEDPCPLPTCDRFEWGVTKPHPLDCTRYIYCDVSGNANIRYCYNGQLYSQTLSRCVPAALADCFVCGATTTQEPTTTTTEEITTTTEEITTTPTPTPTPSTVKPTYPAEPDPLFDLFE